MIALGEIGFYDFATHVLISDSLAFPDTIHIGIIKRNILSRCLKIIQDEKKSSFLEILLDLKIPKQSIKSDQPSDLISMCDRDDADRRSWIS